MKQNIFVRPRLWLLLWVFLPLMPLHLAAQDMDWDALEEAFNEGDVDLLMQNAADQLDITVLDEGDAYSNAQAFYVMEDFFEMYPQAEFTLDESSETEEGALAIGTYSVAENETVLQIYLRVHMTDDGWVLAEIRVEEE